MGFSIINHPAIGVPPFMEIPIYIDKTRDFRWQTLRLLFWAIIIPNLVASPPRKWLKHGILRGPIDQIAVKSKPVKWRICDHNWGYHGGIMRISYEEIKFDTLGQKQLDMILEFSCDLGVSRDWEILPQNWQPAATTWIKHGLLQNHPVVHPSLWQFVR